MTCTMFAILLVLPLCPQAAQIEPSSAGHITLTDNNGAETIVPGAGSTAIGPLLAAWIDEYNRVHAGIRISYRATGSASGVRQLVNGTIAFAATDGPVPDDQLALADGRILHFPVALMAVVPIYNLPRVHDLRFSASTLAGIFLGKITKWDDAAIASENVGVKLPSMDIRVVHGFPGGSAATYVMADYLAKVSPAFKTAMASSSGNWPVANSGAGYRGSEGVAGIVAETPGAIGYIELSRARGNGLRYAAVSNEDSEFVAASPEAVTAASAGVVPLMRTQSPDFRVSITNAPGKKSYPIASFVWLVLKTNPESEKEKEIITHFLKWVLTDGQKLALKLGYPALPGDLVKIELEYLGADGVSH